MKERRKLSRKILTVLLAVVLLVTGMAVSVPAALRITIRDGKVYQNNKPVTNKIVGSKAKGYYYVDKTGRKVNTREIRQAVDFVMRNSKAGDSRAKRLKACYRALQTYPYFGMTNRAPKAKNLSSYARYMFSRHRGDCYYYASTMAYIARVLGYDSRVAVGGVTARGPAAPLSLHGWCEVKYGKSWRMLDCSMQRVHLDRNLCLVTRKKYPFRLRCDKVYTMTVKKAKVKWS
ncbi:transglutaminase-like domain-containing protein [Blautia intestinalis]|uniref:transglutaminase-like domain-containing protein n=1 Tax=Blautia intestinalis TaxID=2763028 RepID=UPI0022E8B445|nr:transglutaminase domain-containing protein [Blautia intestinalis]